jgi:hypothetical protein
LVAKSFRVVVIVVTTHACVEVHVPCVVDTVYQLGWAGGGTGEL